VIKKAIGIIVVLALLVVGWFALRAFQAGRLVPALGNLPTETLRREGLQITVSADGVVRSEQTALLVWKTRGTVEQVPISLGDQVAAGQELARLEAASLSQPVILTRAELINARRALENLRSSNTQRAQTQRAVEQAQRELEEGQSADLKQAEALEAIAQAQKAVEEAERAFYILTHPVSQFALDQAYANRLQAQKVLERTLADIEHYEMKARKSPSTYAFWESRDLYKLILESLELKRIKDQKAFDRADKKYNDLKEPPDPDEVTLAEANLALANSRLEQAQRDWERVSGGASPGEVAVLQAKLADAQREALRWRDGPAAEEIRAAEARVAAAEAVLLLDHITAPFAGTVTQVAVQPGDLVSPGSLAFRLDDDSRLVAEVLVSEVYINRLQAGQPARLVFDAVPGKEYHGVVVDVPEVGEEQGGVVGFRVDIEITDADRLVKPGMTTTATIVVAELPESLLAPNRALRLSEGQRVVYVLRDGQVTPVEVTLGAASEEYSEILAGDLQAGDQVLLETPDQLLSGGGLFRPRMMFRVSR
jgi:HlyD family secretion protein